MHDVTVDSEKLGHGCRMIYADVAFCFGLGRVATFWLIL